MKALEEIRAAGMTDALEVEIYTSVKQRTLYNWFNTHPQRFRATVIGAATIKRKLNLKTIEVNRKRIAIETKDFLERGGKIETVTHLTDAKPIAKHDEVLHV